MKKIKSYGTTTQNSMNIFTGQTMMLKTAPSFRAILSQPLLLNWILTRKGGQHAPSSSYLQGTGQRGRSVLSPPPGFL